MRYKSVIVMYLLSVFLAGCGGGSNGPSSRTARVTIHVEWPASGKLVSRVVPSPVTPNPVMNVEAFLGSQRVGYVQLTKASSTFNVSTANMTLPLGGITFFANEYAAPADPTVYVTDPTTGQVLKNGAPLGAAEANPPLAHAVNTYTVTTANPTITFTLNNTIVAFEVTGTSTFTMDGGTQSLVNTVTALDANGATVLFNPADLSFAIAGPSTDPLAATHASVTAGGVLTPIAVGTFQVLVSDNNVNGPGAALNENQTPITSSLTYQITNPAAMTFALPANINSITPLYAGSVVLSITQNALNSGIPANNPDNPPITPPQNYAVTFNPGTPPTVAVATTPMLSFTRTGRSFFVRFQAWSGANGSGTLIAQTTSATYTTLTDLTADFSVSGATYTYTKPVFAFADYQISGFSVAPTSSAIYGLNGGQTGVPNTVTVQATLVPKAGNTTVGTTIDPRTVMWSSSNNGAATVSLLGVVTGQPVPTLTNAIITATDYQFQTAPNILTSGSVSPPSATVTVSPAQASTIIGVN